MNSLDGAAMLSFNSMENPLHFAYAGHPPVLLSDAPGPANLPLGVMRRVQGVTECTASDGEMLGDNGLSAVLATTDQTDLPQVRQTVLCRMRECAGPKPLNRMTAPFSSRN